MMERGTMKNEEVKKSHDTDCTGYYHEEYSIDSTEDNDISLGCDVEGDINRMDEKKTEGQILRPNASRLDNYEYEKIIRMMEDLEIKCTESGNNRDILKKHLFCGDWRGSQSEREMPSDPTLALCCVWAIEKAYYFSLETTKSFYHITP